MVTSLAKAITSATGMKAKVFVEKELRLNYTTFRYRVRHNVLRLEDYHRILAATGLSFEELFPNPFGRENRLMHRITLTVGKDAARKELRKPVKAAPLPSMNMEELKQDLKHHQFTEQEYMGKKEKTPEKLPDVDNLYDDMDLGAVSSIEG